MNTLSDEPRVWYASGDVLPNKMGPYPSYRECADAVWDLADTFTIWCEPQVEDKMPVPKPEPKPVPLTPDDHFMPIYDRLTKIMNEMADIRAFQESMADSLKGVRAAIARIVSDKLMAQASAAKFSRSLYQCLYCQVWEESKAAKEPCPNRTGHDFV